MLDISYHKERFVYRLSDFLYGKDLNDMAVKADLGLGTLYRYKSGKRFPYLKDLRKLSLGLNISTDYLLGLINEQIELKGDCVTDFYSRFRKLYFDKKLGMTVEKMCEQYKIGSSQLGAYYRRDYHPNIVNGIKLSQLFGCSLDYLLGISNSRYYVGNGQALF